MKKNVLYFLLIIVLIIPSLVALKSYFDAQNAPASAKNTLCVQIDDINGNTYRLEKDKDPDEMEEVLESFLSMNSKATKILALPDTISSQKCFRVTVKTAIKDEAYQYFMSTTPTLCYMVDPDGSTYQLAEADAAKFLESKYAESLYPAAKRPVLTLSNEYTVSPTKSEWNYKTSSQNYVTADTSNVTTNKKQHFDIAGGISANFDIIPDLCHVKITDAEGITLYDDVADNLSNLRIEEEISVKVEISAKWYEESKRDYNGENEYSFTATLNPPAAFYVHKTELDAGEFFAISTKGVKDTKKISYKCEPELPTTPVFYVEGDYAHALLAVPFDTEPGTYKITLTCGSTVQEVPITVKENKKTDAFIEVDEGVLASVYTEATVKEFEDLVKTLTAETSDKRLFDGGFLSAPGGSILTRGFGRRIVINNDFDKSFVSTAVTYMNGLGTDIPAVASGKVVYVGNLAFTGNIVVIDHGFGLKTWYYGLDSVKVEKDASVSRGDAIGTAGKTGLTNGVAGVNIAMSVGDTFVCPYDAWDNGDGGILMEGVYTKK